MEGMENLETTNQEYEERGDYNILHAISLNESLHRSVAGHCSYYNHAMAMREGASTPIFVPGASVSEKARLFFLGTAKHRTARWMPTSGQ